MLTAVPKYNFLKIPIFMICATHIACAALKNNLLLVFRGGNTMETNDRRLRNGCRAYHESKLLAFNLLSPEHPMLIFRSRSVILLLAVLKLSTYLGSPSTVNCPFTSHIKELCKKSNKKVRALRRV